MLKFPYFYKEKKAVKGLDAHTWILNRALHVKAKAKVDTKQMYTTGGWVNKLYCSHTMKHSAALYHRYRKISAVIITAFVAQPYLKNDTHIYTLVFEKVRRSESIMWIVSIVISGQLDHRRFCMCVFQLISILTFLLQNIFNWVIFDFKKCWLSYPSLG